MPKNELRLDTQFRSGTFDRAAADEDARTVDISFSSEAPYERWWGVEVLGHDRSEVDMSFMGGGAAPLLDAHNTREQIGVVVSAEIGSDRKGRATVRFGRGARAEEIYRDVLDGIRSNVSVGYEIRDLLLVKEEDGVPTYRVTDWMPLEVSIVSIPADPSVGVGREAARQQDVQQGKPVTIKRSSEMPEALEKPAEKPANKDAPAADTGADVRAARTEAAAQERERIRLIAELGARHHKKDLADKAIADGTSIEAFRGIMLDAIGNSKPLETSNAELGMSESEARQFSIVRAMAALSQPNNRALAEAATFEFEASAEIAKKLGRGPRGFFVPLEVQGIRTIDMQAVNRVAGANGRRDMVVGTPTAGGNLVETSLVSFIELLRNRMMVRTMGATVLSGLQGDIAIPKQTGAGTAFWLAESAEPTETQQAVGQVPLAPKTIGAYTDYSRKLLLQSSIDIENFVRADLSTILALGIDLAALHGTGTGDQPLGIAGTAGIGSVVGGTNGAAPTWPNIVALETEVSAANADVGSLGYLTNALVRGTLKTTEKATGTAQFVWGDNMAQPGFGMMNGYRAGVSNQVASDLDKGTSVDVCSAIFFGNWADLLIGEWGVLDILVNPYTGANAGTVRIHVFQSVDVAVRNAVSFSAMLDALTP